VPAVRLEDITTLSKELDEFRDMVKAIRRAGAMQYCPTPSELGDAEIPSSLFVVAGVKVGGTFTEKNVRFIRSAHSLHPRHLPDVLRRKAKPAVCGRTPLKWDMIAEPPL
jgi:pseudaminic acid synthase